MIIPSRLSDKALSALSPDCLADFPAPAKVAGPTDASDDIRSWALSQEEGFENFHRLLTQTATMQRHGHWPIALISGLSDYARLIRALVDGGSIRMKFNRTICLRQAATMHQQLCFRPTRRWQARQIDTLSEGSEASCEVQKEAGFPLTTSAPSA